MEGIVTGTTVLVFLFLTMAGRIEWASCRNRVKQERPTRLASEAGGALGWWGGDREWPGGVWGGEMSQPSSAAAVPRCSMWVLFLKRTAAGHTIARWLYSRCVSG